MPEITYRTARKTDAQGISTLILDSQREYCFHEYTEDGQKTMLRSCGTQAIESYIERGDVYYVALNENIIIGVAGIRNNDHLNCNFVNASYHRRGISKELWRLATEECCRRGNQGSYTLRASTYAIPVYEKWGFVKTGPTNQEQGITSTPMALKPKPETSELE